MFQITYPVIRVTLKNWRLQANLDFIPNYKSKSDMYNLFFDISNILNYFWYYFDKNMTLISFCVPMHAFNFLLIIKTNLLKYIIFRCPHSLTSAAQPQGRRSACTWRVVLIRVKERLNIWVKSWLYVQLLNQKNSCSN